MLRIKSVTFNRLPAHRISEAIAIVNGVCGGHNPKLYFRHAPGPLVVVDLGDVEGVNADDVELTITRRLGGPGVQA